MHRFVHVFFQRDQHKQLIENVYYIKNVPKDYNAQNTMPFTHAISYMYIKHIQHMVLYE